MPAVGSSTCLWMGGGRQGSHGFCLSCRWKGRLSRAWASSPWRSYTTPPRGACTPVAPAPTRSPRLAASPQSSGCPCFATAPTRRPSMPPRYCCPGSVLPSICTVGNHPPWGSAGSLHGREREGPDRSLGQMMSGRGWRWGEGGGEQTRLGA